MAAVDGIPALSARVRAGRREEPFKGAADLPNFFRKPYGPGWALVGDAGCHKDPMLALGMCDALRDAELLVEALDDGLSGGRPLDDALRDYQRRRDEASADDFRENLDGRAVQARARRGAPDPRRDPGEAGRDEAVLHGAPGHDPARDVLQPRESAAPVREPCTSTPAPDSPVREPRDRVRRPRWPCGACCSCCCSPTWPGRRPG